MAGEGLGLYPYINSYNGLAYHPDGTPMTVRSTPFTDFHLTYDHFPAGLNIDSLEVVKGLMVNLTRPLGIKPEVTTLDTDLGDGDDRGNLSFVFKLQDDGKQIGYMRAGECAEQLAKGQPGMDRLREQLAIMVRDQRGG